MPKNETKPASEAEEDAILEFPPIGLKYVKKEPKKKHEIVELETQYRSGDCILYKLKCACGKECGAWSEDEARERYKKHFKEARNE